MEEHQHFSHAASKDETRAQLFLKMGYTMALYAEPTR